EEDDQHARGADREGDERGVGAARAPAPHERRRERPEEDPPHAEGPGERLEVEVDVAAPVEAGGREEAEERLGEEGVAEAVGAVARTAAASSARRRPASTRTRS